ncbi:MAG: hypothetical protein UR83_C0056G0012 [Candidatus Moranbacteria bacterium GW2011_GWF2_35_54]|nr:MAG: hypothetical protein UR83_C0056G0012 [Candidatus Moranbacteria bacterium GW2011_GWF2_35_54]
MRFRIVAIFLVMAVVFSLKCVEAGIKKEMPDLVSEELLKCTSADDSDDSARRELFESYMDPLDEDNPVAVNVINSLREILFLAKPASLDNSSMLVISTLEAIDGSKFIPVVPMLSGDEEIGPEWEIEIKGPTFVQDPPMLIVKDEEMLSYWKRISMLHEGSHILSFVTKAFESIENPLDRRAIDEYCAYTLIFEILDKKGGEEYKKILSEKAALIKEKFLKDKAYLAIDFSEAERLNNAFAEAPQILWIHSTFMAMEQLNANNDKEGKQAKINYMFALFENQFE